MTLTSKLFTEIFRPKEIKKMVLPDRIRQELEKGLSQNMLFYSTSPGSGKTTATRILSEGYDILYINASAERGIDVIRESIMNFAGTYTFDGASGKKVVVLEEMDGLTTDSFNALRAVIEKYSDNVRFIGNCNNINKIPEPIQSRFNCIPFYPINVEENNKLFDDYCSYVSAVLNISKIGIKYDDETLREFVKTYFPNMRSIMNAIQSLSTQGITELNRDAIIKTFNCSDLFESIFNSNDPVENYKLVMSSYSSDVDSTMAAFSTDFINFIISTHPDKIDRIPCSIIAIANYVSQLSTSIDKVLVLLATVYKLQEIMK